MKTTARLFVTMLIMMLTAQAAFGSDSETRPAARSATHGKTGVAYMGSVDVNMYLGGLTLRTAHGVIFTDCNVFLGGSAEIGATLIGTTLSASAYSRWFWPHEKKVQGFIGLEAGALRGFGTEGPSTEEENRRHDPFWAPNIVPEIGFCVNFSKVSLDFSMRFQQLIFLFDTPAWTNYLPALSVGILF